jgi:hypothetical protein
MSTVIRSAVIALALLGGISVASARPMDTPYDNATPRSQINLNSADGAKAFWEAQERNGN